MSQESKNTTKVEESSSEKKDSGLRVQANGTLYVNRKVFYNRSGVKDTLKKMRASKAYPNTKVFTESA